jgi:hypothetical protein
MQHDPERENDAEAGKRGEVILLRFWRADNRRGCAGYTLPSSWPCTRHDFWRLKSVRDN